MKFLIINGPNLNLLGKREPEIYGSETLDEIMTWLKATPEARGHQLEHFQSNHEGSIIERIHNAWEDVDGIIINPGAFTHYSYAIRDALAAVGITTVEVHLSDINQREDFRKISVIAPVCLGQVSGLGKESYLEGLKKLIHSFINKN
ncbi:MAG: type II 3-dehydroquinate dehydratase [Fidelibacterota bacterium]